MANDWSGYRAGEQGLASQLNASTTPQAGAAFDAINNTIKANAEAAQLISEGFKDIDKAATTFIDVGEYEKVIDRELDEDEQVFLDESYSILNGVNKTMPASAQISQTAYANAYNKYKNTEDFKNLTSNEDRIKHIISKIQQEPDNTSYAIKGSTEEELVDTVMTKAFQKTEANQEQQGEQPSIDLSSSDFNIVKDQISSMSSQELQKNITPLTNQLTEMIFGNMNNNSSNAPQGEQLSEEQKYAIKGSTYEALEDTIMTKAFQEIEADREQLFQQKANVLESGEHFLNSEYNTKIQQARKIYMTGGDQAVAAFLGIQLVKDSNGNMVLPPEDKQKLLTAFDELEKFQKSMLAIEHGLNANTAKRNAQFIKTLDSGFLFRHPEVAQSLLKSSGDIITYLNNLYTARQTAEKQKTLDAEQRNVYNNTNNKLLAEISKQNQGGGTSSFSSSVTTAANNTNKTADTLSNDLNNASNESSRPINVTINQDGSGYIQGSHIPPNSEVTKEINAANNILNGGLRDKTMSPTDDGSLKTTKYEVGKVLNDGGIEEERLIGTEIQLSRNDINNIINSTDENQFIESITNIDSKFVPDVLGQYLYRVSTEDNPIKAFSVLDTAFNKKLISEETYKQYQDNLLLYQSKLNDSAKQDPSIPTYIGQAPNGDYISRRAINNEYLVYTNQHNQLVDPNTGKAYQFYNKDNNKSGYLIENNKVYFVDTDSKGQITKTPSSEILFPRVIRPQDKSALAQYGQKQLGVIYTDGGVARSVYVEAKSSTNNNTNSDKNNSVSDSQNDYSMKVLTEQDEYPLQEDKSIKNGYYKRNLGIVNCFLLEHKRKLQPDELEAWQKLVQAVSEAGIDLKDYTPTKFLEASINPNTDNNLVIDVRNALGVVTNSDKEKAYVKKLAVGNSNMMPYFRINNALDVQNVMLSIIWYMDSLPEISGHATSMSGINKNPNDLTVIIK